MPQLHKHFNVMRKFDSIAKYKVRTTNEEYVKKNPEDDWEDDSNRYIGFIDIMALKIGCEETK
jgi:hypothetical protein